MSNLVFERYLNNFLTDVPVKKGKRPTYKDIAEASGLSRTTLYNWGAGEGVAKAEHVRKLAAGLKKIDRELAEAAGVEPRLAGEDAVFKTLWSLLQDPIDADPTDAAYRFVSYKPISMRPHNVADGLGHDSARWSFLGATISNFLAATDQEETKFIDAHISDLTTVRGRDVLVGYFATPDRYRDWDFIKTPLQIPMNAVVFREDADQFRERVLTNRRPDMAALSVERYVSDKLADMIWLPDAKRGSAKEDIQPILGVDEVGWRYARDILGFPDEDLHAYKTEGGRLDAEAFAEKLSAASSDFRLALSSGKGIPRLPVVIVDEFTAFEIRRDLHARGALLVSDLKSDVWRPGTITRPRYAVGIAFRRDPLASTPSRAYLETKRMFDDFLWTNAGPVANSYLTLYKELIEMFGSQMVYGLAPLYFLRWLSLNVTIADIEDPSRFDPHDVDFADIPDLGPWRAILRSAKSLILKDPDLVKNLKTLIVRRGREQDQDRQERLGQVDGA